LIIGFLVR